MWWMWRRRRAGECVTPFSVWSVLERNSVAVVIRQTFYSYSRPGPRAKVPSPKMARKAQETVL